MNRATPRMLKRYAPIVSAGALALKDPGGKIGNENLAKNVSCVCSGIAWSNLGFLTVVLGFGCVYIWRKDF